MKIIHIYFPVLNTWQFSCLFIFIILSFLFCGKWNLFDIFIIKEFFRIFCSTFSTIHVNERVVLSGVEENVYVRIWTEISNILNWNLLKHHTRISSSPIDWMKRWFSPFLASIPFIVVIVWKGIPNDASHKDEKAKKRILWHFINLSVSFLHIFSLFCTLSTLCCLQFNIHTYIASLFCFTSSHSLHPIISVFLRSK